MAPATAVSRTQASFGEKREKLASKNDYKPKTPLPKPKNTHTAVIDRKITTDRFTKTNDSKAKPSLSAKTNADKIKLPQTVVTDEVGVSRELFYQPAQSSTSIGNQYGHENIFCKEENRLSSFRGWTNDNVTPEALAKAGFYYTKLGDGVKCPECDLELINWEKGEDPIRVHYKHRPNCKFLSELPEIKLMEKEKFERRKSLNVIPVSDSAKYPVYTKLADRMKTYEHWPISMRQKPEELSESGFFYLGTGDKTVCFYCGCGLKDWEVTDDPWEEHAKVSMDCAYLIFQKGQNFIDKVHQKINSSEAESAVKLNEESKDQKKTEEPKNSEESEQLLCKICYNREMAVTFLPCGHLTCIDCAPIFTKCPYCKADIQEWYKVYII